jgi:catechol 2,3-dioxygenase-like lactoylglutathione lyase family enzyme
MMRRAGLYVAGGLLFVSGFVAGTLTKSTSAQEKPGKGLKLLVFGIGVKDYAQSQNFYEKIMGLPVAFKFTSPDGKRTTTYYQVGRDSFLEMQPVVENAEPGLTHAHLLTEDLTAEVARLRQAGLTSAARNATTPGTVTETGIAEPSHIKYANVFDPNGIRLELNELLHDSLTKKAMDSWK